MLPFLSHLNPVKPDPALDLHGPELTTETREWTTCHAGHAASLPPLLGGAYLLPHLLRIVIKASPFRVLCCLLHQHHMVSHPCSSPLSASRWEKSSLPGQRAPLDSNRHGCEEEEEPRCACSAGASSWGRGQISWGSRKSPWHQTWKQLLYCKLSALWWLPTACNIGLKLCPHYSRYLEFKPILSIFFTYLWIRTNQTTSPPHTHTRVPFPRLCSWLLFSSNISYILHHQKPTHASRPSSSKDPCLQPLPSHAASVNLISGCASTLQRLSCSPWTWGGSISGPSLLSRHAQQRAEPAFCVTVVTGKRQSTRQSAGVQVRVYRSKPIWGAMRQLLNNDGNYRATSLRRKWQLCLPIPRKWLLLHKLTPTNSSTRNRKAIYIHKVCMN